MKRVLVVGGKGGTNVGESLTRAGASVGVQIELIDQSVAMQGPAIVRKILWRAARRPQRLNAFSKRVVERADQFGADILIATGAAPLTRDALVKLRSAGVFTINFSTDDPWNPVHRARWHLEALPFYTVVLTPRKANIDDFRRIGCVDVRYLPFGYDDELSRPPDAPFDGPAPDVLFVGGGDDDRAAFFRDYLDCGQSLTLAGSYWDRYEHLAKSSLGQIPPEPLRRVTAAAAVNLCLVRRANRDGHVMRSFEIPAVGGFMIAEDTQEHRALFGPDGEGVLYFSSPVDAARHVAWALANPVARQRMAEACRAKLIQDRHSYRDRLSVMIEIATR